jgi:hypothetical protein
MQRLHAERAICFELAPQAQNLAFKGEEQDLFEMLGNLIDNAGKWARQRGGGHPAARQRTVHHRGRRRPRHCAG